MSTHRVYKSHEFMQPAEKEPIRSVVVESSHSVIVAWHVEPGQTIAPHIHPDGQDTWTILSGEGQYQIDEQGNTVAIVPGDIVVANKGQVHGVLCTSVGPLRFISVVAPLDAGYEPLSAKTWGYQVQQAASAPQPNCLVKLTPTGSACWYPPLRSGAAYRGR